MKKNLYQQMMEKTELSPERDLEIRRTILQEEARWAHHCKRPVFRALTVAAVIVLLVGSALAVPTLFRSDLFQPALGEKASQWEPYISGEVFMEVETDHFEIQVDNLLCTASSINFVATLYPTDEMGREWMPEIGLDCCPGLQRADGTYIVGGMTTKIQRERTEEPDMYRYVCSFTLATADIAQECTLALNFSVYRLGMSEYDFVELLDAGEGRGTLNSVDTSNLNFTIASDHIEKVTLTPLSVLVYGAPGEPGNAAEMEHWIEDLRLVCQDGTELIVENESKTGTICRGGVGDADGEVFTRYYGIEAVELSQISGIWLNGVYYPVEGI